MDEIQADQDFQMPAHLKMTITHASSSEPLISMTDNGADAKQSLINGNSSSGNQSSSNTLQQGHGRSGSDDKQKYKTSSSSHKSSPSTCSKDVSRHKDPTGIENQNGFSKSKDHRHSSSSSSSKPRDHSSSSRDKEKRHSSSSSPQKDYHSSSKSKEHSSLSSKSESSLKNRDGSGLSSKEGSSSKKREGISGKDDLSSRTSDGDKARSSSGASKPNLTSSKSSNSHKELKDKHQSSSNDKASRGDSGRSSEKHHHRSDRHTASNLVGRSGDLASPVQVKTETVSPPKAQLGSKPIAKSDDEDDAPLFSRLQKADNIGKEVKVEPKDEDDAALFSPLKNAKSRATSDDDDDVPLMARLDKVKVKPEGTQSPSKKRKYEDSGDESDEPLAVRMEKVKKIKVEEKVSKKRKNYDDDFAPKKSKDQSKKKQIVKEEQESPKKSKKQLEADAADETKWKWWEENKRDEGVKWNTLEHKGPVFAPPYEPLPNGVTFYYDGKVVKLSEPAEEVATFYARMLDHDYTTRDLFNSNFFKDWRKVMTSKERELITDLKKCNFKELDIYFKEKSEERKNMSKEEKLAIKKENEKMQKEYGFCIIDGHKQKIGNFKIEPPGLFRGRGDHPKQGMLKKRTRPEDVILNCSKGSKVPTPPPGHKWKEVRHDNTVTWLASWSENIQGSIKYIMLNAASRLKGEKDWMKYETARRLHKCVDKIRRNYREDWKSKEMKIRQRAVALYFIDKLALRAGNEKDEDTADTVGCCSLRVEHIKLHEELNGEEFVVEFDFLGKDSIRYYNTVSIEKRVFKNLQLFMENKQEGDDVFDRLNTTILNKHLQSLMEGLTAKVFRTYNASHTLQQQLDLLTNPDDNMPAKLLSYNRANRAVAVLCNHQRAAPKNFDKQMENLQSKIDAKKEAIKVAKKELKDAKSDYKAKHSESARSAVTKKEKALERLKEQLVKLEVQATDKDENKEIALGTSKLNYLDPRITVSWCKKWNVPIEKVYNKTQREKFAWAIDMADKDYCF